MNLFLFVYDEACGTHEEVLEFVDHRAEIVNWLAVLPSSVFLVSDKEITALSKVFHKRFSTGMYLLTGIDGENTDGLLRLNDWNFINDPSTL